MSTGKYKKYIAIMGDGRYFIEEDRPEVGWYLHVYQNGQSTADDLKEDFDGITAHAASKYGVPADIWEEVDKDPVWAR